MAEIVTTHRKKHIPKSLRENLWLKYNGKVYQAKCYTAWCQNTVTVHDFQAGHNIPESKGGPTVLENLVPICSRCNTSMGNQYTFDEWQLLEGRKRQWWRRFLCFSRPVTIPPSPPSTGPSKQAKKITFFRDILPASLARSKDAALASQPLPKNSAVRSKHSRSATPQTPRFS